MFLLRKKIVGVVIFMTLLFFLIQPAVAEMSISERSLPADTVIKDVFKAGSGLPVGKIQSVRGETLIFHSDPTVGYRAQTGLPLYQGDILQTRANAWILCRLVDGSRLTIAPGTMLTILQSNSNSAKNSSLSFLSLKQGGVRFYVKANPEASAFEFKVQTETAFVLAKEADFIVKANPGQTEISTFEKSRLELTSLAEPEEIHILADYQRIVVKPEPVAPMVETISPMDAEVRMAEFRLVPDSKLFAFDANNDRTHDTTNEPPQE
jgi:hypothetical protein